MKPLTHFPFTTMYQSSFEHIIMLVRWPVHFVGLHLHLCPSTYSWAILDNYYVNHFFFSRLVDVA